MSQRHNVTVVDVMLSILENAINHTTDAEYENLVNLSHSLASDNGYLILGFEIASQTDTPPVSYIQMFLTG